MQFYVLELEVGASHDTTFHPMEPIHRGGVADCKQCPICGRPVGSLPWLPPYRAEIVLHRRTFGDIAFSGSDLLVSEKFRHAWEGAKLKGIETFHPLERVRIRPARWAKNAVTYYYVEPHRFGTRIDLSRSLIEYNKPFTCTACFDAGIDSIRGFRIDESSWTGEDIFIPWGEPGSIVVTDRVRQLRDEYGLTNVMLTPTEKYFLDFYYRWSVIDYSRDEPAPSDEPIPNDDTSSLN